MSSLRDSYNRITSPYPGLNSGWAIYEDDQYTEGSPLSIASGNTANLTNNAATSDASQAPQDQPMLYDGTRILANKLGDAYSVRVNFRAESPITAGAFLLYMDISAAGDGSHVIFGDTQRLVRGAGQDEQYSETFVVYAGQDFVDNGALMRIESIDNTISIFEISFLINKIHSGK